MCSTPAGAPAARFTFQHPDLRRPGAAFLRDDGRQTILTMQFGDLRGSLPFDRVAGSLQLPPDDPDRALIALVPEALLYMRQVRADDPVPSELSNGQPSWTPGPHVMQRAIATVRRALQQPQDGINLTLPGDGISVAGPTGTEMRRIASAVLGLLPGSTIEEMERRLQNAVLDVARVDWLRRATGTLQRTVGELAQFAARRTTDPAGEMARRSALLLRDAAIWGTEKAMAADAAVGDILRLLAEPDLLYNRAWPLVCALRALILDVEPVMLQWSQATAQSDGPRPRDLEQILRLTSQRYGSFDPTLFLRAGVPVQTMRYPASPTGGPTP